MGKKWTRVIDGLPEECTPVYVRFLWNHNDKFDYAYAWRQSGGWHLFHYMYGSLTAAEARPYEWTPLEMV